MSSHRHDKSVDHYLVHDINDPDEWMAYLRDDQDSPELDDVEQRLITTFVNRRIIPRLKRIRKKKKPEETPICAECGETHVGKKWKAPN